MSVTDHWIETTLEELHAMADRIGVQSKWFQNKTRYPHYDICKSKRALAVAAGAQQVSSKVIVLHAKALRLRMIQESTAQ